MQETTGETAGGGGAGGTQTGGQPAQQGQLDLASGASGQQPASQEPVDPLADPKVQAELRRREKAAKEAAVAEARKAFEAEQTKAAERAKLDAEARAKAEAEDARKAKEQAEARAAEAMEAAEVTTAMLVAGALPQDEFAAKMIRAAAKELKAADANMTWTMAVEQVKAKMAYLFRQAGPQGQAPTQQAGAQAPAQQQAAAGQQGQGAQQGQTQQAAGPIATLAARTLTTGSPTPQQGQQGNAPKDAYSMNDEEWSAVQRRFGVR